MESGATGNTDQKERDWDWDPGLETTAGTERTTNLTRRFFI